jgi:hypothetical protein
MNDLFLRVDGVGTEEQALTWSINAALQRNRVYQSEENYEERDRFRAAWADLLIRESQLYRTPAAAISDDEHSAKIEQISAELSEAFGGILTDGRLRFGTSQKAFNLYLKYLWSMGKAATPPHCPIDSVILARIGVSGSWTKCDSCEEYMRWINEIRKHLSLAEWEHDVWLRWRLSNS